MWKGEGGERKGKRGKKRGVVMGRKRGTEEKKRKDKGAKG